METSDSKRFDIFQIYRRFCEIKTGNAYHCCEAGYIPNDESGKASFTREALAQLSKLVDSRMNVSTSLFEEVFKLMSQLNLMADFSEFSNFYDFVFFVCRENGQKNITVRRAVTAWKLVLAGRFRLLNHWCDFVEKNQQHNISEDTWRQVLAFSRCVREDLEGYDPEGAWPTLIDDFVEHIYSGTSCEVKALWQMTKASTTSWHMLPKAWTMFNYISRSNDSISRDFTCNYGDPVSQPSIPQDSLPVAGLKNFPGLKRKHCDEGLEISSSLDRYATVSLFNSKIRKLERWANCKENPPGKASDNTMEMSKQNSPLCSSKRIHLEVLQVAYQRALQDSTRLVHACSLASKGE